jgi:hypothetical protein
MVALSLSWEASFALKMNFKFAHNLKPLQRESSYLTYAIDKWVDCPTFIPPALSLCDYLRACERARNTEAQFSNFRPATKITIDAKPHGMHTHTNTRGAWK